MCKKYLINIIKSIYITNISQYVKYVCLKCMIHLFIFSAFDSFSAIIKVAINLSTSIFTRETNVKFA